MLLILFRSVIFYHKTPNFLLFSVLYSFYISNLKIALKDFKKHGFSKLEFKIMVTGPFV